MENLEQLEELMKIDEELKRDINSLEYEIEVKREADKVNKERWKNLTETVKEWRINFVKTEVNKLSEVEGKLPDKLILKIKEWVVKLVERDSLIDSFICNYENDVWYKVLRFTKTGDLFSSLSLMQILDLNKGLLDLNTELLEKENIKEIHIDYKSLCKSRDLHLHFTSPYKLNRVVLIINEFPIPTKYSNFGIEDIEISDIKIKDSIVSFVCE